MENNRENAIKYFESYPNINSNDVIKLLIGYADRLKEKNNCSICVFFKRLNSTDSWLRRFGQCKSEDFLHETQACEDIKESFCCKYFKENHENKNF